MMLASVQAPHATTCGVQTNVTLVHPMKLPKVQAHVSEQSEHVA